MTTTLRPCLSHAGAAALLLAACLDANSIPAEPAPSIVNQPLTAYQSELLDLAFGAASALPVNPHLKNRSLAQEGVVTACLALEQPERALSCIERIGNWRRGAGYADYAFYLAQRGAIEQVPHFLELARQVAEDPAEESGQGWRSDRIRAKIARVHLWLGQTEQAAAAAAGIADSEADELADVRALQADADDFDAHVATIDAIVATLNFDLVRNALVDGAHLFGRFYDDAARRGQLEAKIKASWGSLPLLVRLELMRMLTEQALQRSDQAKALALVNEALLILDGADWAPADEIQQRAQLAALRHRAGDAAQARADADAALGLFEVERVQIVDIDRAEALRHLAEAYQTMGDAGAARAVIKQAVTEATVNPNSRPRAMDLARLSTTLAVAEIEPDAELWEQLRAALGSLGEPW